MAFSDDHIPDIGSLTVASLPTFIKIVAAYEAHRAIVVHDSKVWSSKSARTLLEDKKLVPKKWLAVKGWRSQLTEVVCRVIQHYKGLLVYDGSSATMSVAAYKETLPMDNLILCVERNCDPFGLYSKQLLAFFVTNGWLQKRRGRELEGARQHVE